ncbi:hypothetical protein [Polaromonas sp.]|uniref:hypothetical protein n=1 Tax=Polaromonas sp. TaxID=1869339 RepID=UPI00286C292F|nr:hypothetical protein [Polaromonas sp.]
MNYPVKKFRLLLNGIVASLALWGAALPVYAVGNNCSFRTKGLIMSFGNLNPSSGSDVLVAVLGASTAGDCANGQTMMISGDNGLNFNGNRNLRSGTGNLIAYSLVGLPQSSGAPGNGNYVPFTFNGSILWSDYANAPAGIYADTVIISVSP